VLNKSRLQAIAHVLFLYAKKSSPATAIPQPVSRAFQRCVVSTGRRFLGPQHQARRACASYCSRALHVRSETFFFYAIKSSPATAIPQPVSRAFQRCVMSTGRRFLGPQHQATRASVSYCQCNTSVRCIWAVKLFFCAQKKAA
jgi:hypothetical protein